MRIGIITLYHNNNNYGGKLQAYALCKAISTINEDASVEQISYDFSKNATLSLPKKALKRVSVMCKTFVKILVPSRRRIYFKSAKRKKAFKDFDKYIPHTKTVYNKNTVHKCANNYDMFITGSDQVWNPAIWTSAFLLGFVPKEKIKISYAASIAQPKLAESHLAIFNKYLKDYNAISVREEISVDLIKDFSLVPVEYVLDPVLLLSRDDWDKVCSKPLIDQDYIFVYFLGKTGKNIEEIKRFAKEKSLKIVEIGGMFANTLFDDTSVDAVSPQMFISLVKHAKYVITDSFHATVFSWIYKKQFFVTNRDEHGGMNSRIYSLLDMFELKERFLEDKSQITVDTLVAMKDIDYEKEAHSFEKMKQTSVSFLKKAISME